LAPLGAAPVTKLRAPWDRLEIIFGPDGKKLEQKYIKKIRLADVVREINAVMVKISLSEERVSEDAVNMDSAAMARFRHRCSFIDPDGQWRTDFTLVFTVQSTHLNKLAQIKSHIFPVHTTRGTSVVAWAEYVEEMYGLVMGPLKGLGLFTHELETEFIGQVTDLTGASVEDYIYSFLQLIDPRLAEVAALRKLANLVGHRPTRSIKQFANQPIVLDEKTFVSTVLPKLHEFYLSDKADGERALLYENKLLFSDRIEILGQSVPSSNLVLDCEVTDDDGATRLFYFDILYRGNENYSERDFAARNKAMTELEADTLKPKKGATAVTWPDGVVAAKKIQIQLVEDRANAADQVTNLYSRSTKMYPIDGLIFTSGKGSYFDMSVYKWKPPASMTIDFLAMHISDNIADKYRQMLIVRGCSESPSGRLYALFCGISSRQQRTIGLKEMNDYVEILGDFANLHGPAAKFYPIQFAPPDCSTAFIYQQPASEKLDLHGHVGEFIYDMGTHNWTLLKLRPDKDRDVLTGAAFGNSYSTAANIWASYAAPFSIERLVELIKNPTKAAAVVAMTRGSADYGTHQSTDYFHGVKENMHKALTKFNSFVKAQVIRQLEGANLVVDFCSGKGQDMHIYSGFGVRNIIMVDQDKPALDEAYRRLNSLTDRRFYVYAPPPKQLSSFYFVNSSVERPIDEMLELPVEHSSQRMTDVLPNIGAKALVMNFALHYLDLGPTGLVNFIETVKRIVAPGGLFIFTCFSGRRIVELLKNVAKGSFWDVNVDGSKKYSIRKQYDGVTPAAIHGLEIELVHPFSAGEYYKERLVDIDLVIRSFIKAGFQFRQSGSFANWLNKYNEFRSDLAAKLTKDDVRYASLYQYVSLYRVR
jgi:SAM-dependent methyltransferase